MKAWICRVLLGALLGMSLGGAVEEAKDLKASQSPTITTIYISPMSHLDIGFTAPPSVVAQKMRKTVQQALEAAKRDPDYVWTLETFWQLEQWLESKPSEAEVQWLLHLLRAGRFGLGAGYVNPHSTVMSGWLLDKLFRLPVEWAKSHGLTLTTAILNDVPGHPLDLPHFLARNGVRYLVIGANLQFSPPLPKEIARTPFWWKAPTGERVLTWISDRSYTEAFVHLGFDPETARFFNPSQFRDPDPMRVMEQSIEETIKDYQKRGYPYDAILVLHAFDNWDASASIKLPFFAQQWNQRHRTPQIRLAPPQAFFEHIERCYGASLPVYQGGFGGQWESFVRPAIPTAMRCAKEAERRIRAMKPPDRHLLRLLLTFYDHNFGMGVPWENMMSRAEAIQHNREQRAVLASLCPKTFKKPEVILQDLIKPPLKETTAEEDSSLSPGLYWTTTNPMFAAPKPKDLHPLPPKVLVGWKTRSLNHNGLQIDYWIDRRRLPADSGVILWLWPLKKQQAFSKVRNRIATGWETLPDDRLLGYDWGGWCSPFGFRIGEWEYKGDGILSFRKQRLDHQDWLIGLCLSQRLVALFKGGERKVMKFEEAYPGEEAVVRISMTLRKVKPR